MASPSVTIRQPEPADAALIALAMAPIDIAECAAVGFAPLDALRFSERQSVLCWTGEVDGEPQAMFGVMAGNFVTGHGYPWLLGTTQARTAQRAFLREAPKYLAQIEALFPRLEGIVSARNAVAIRWLQRLGFVIEDNQVHLRGEPMRRFVKGF